MWTLSFLIISAFLAVTIFKHYENNILTLFNSIIFYTLILKTILIVILIIKLVFNLYTVSEVKLEKDLYKYKKTSIVLKTSSKKIVSFIYNISEL
ncbi:hypothetical protein SGLAD_v1c08960 [Spiroplasma gladiatoris]|uniref:Uncharacterized protein n=1 Tax=Spiroplasma gladiatoris TaxID=2143 RepID=A0A4P7AI09_9MOLU|nr:hypothetical protein SGLAD_v1c08960 [Spiroplasma gladiatoris]